MDRKKRMKIVLLTVSLFLIIIAAAGITLAYLTDNDSKNNTVFIGKDEIEITEDKELPKEQEQDEPYKKKVSVKNTGDIPCYVRVKAEFSKKQIETITYFATAEDKPDKDANGSWFSAVPSDKSDSFINHLPDKWVYDDGYYYYTEPIGVGESTSNLFTYVLTRYAEADDIQDYSIIIYAESVQTINDDGSSYADYTAAWDNIKPI